MNNVTVKFGSRSVGVQVAPGTTGAQVIGMAWVKSSLGYGDNVTAVANGVEVLSSAVVDGSVIEVQTKANSKA